MVKKMNIVSIYDRYYKCNMIHNFLEGLFESHFSFSLSFHFHIFT